MLNPIMYAYNLENVISAINEVSGMILRREHIAPTESPVLWFRGHSNLEYSLLPTFFREIECKEGNDLDMHYNEMHVNEDIKTQAYIAKNLHLLKNVPSNRVEWLEVMQHHGVKTRLLDWTESLIHALLFALEIFFKEDGKLEDARRKASPCIWVMEPQKINEENVNELLKNANLRSKIFCELGEEAAEKIIKKIDEDIDEKKIKHYLSMQGNKHLNFIFNLSTINDEILRERGRLQYLLKKGEVLNPVYYMLSRIYSDAMPIETYELAPLSIFEAYHSERIRAQHGVFTVFPVYKYDDSHKKCKEIGFDTWSMENAESCNPYLYCIRLQNPQKMAGELLKMGINTSWLYPELPAVANEIEYRKIF